jgi:hypothetical protein
MSIRENWMRYIKDKDREGKKRDAASYALTASLDIKLIRLK